MNIQLSVQVNAPVERVFAIFSDVQKSEEWVKGITKLEMLSDVTSGVGTRWRETRIMFGKEATEEMEISAYEPNKSYEVTAENMGMNYHTLFTFTPSGDGTRVEMVFTGTPTTLTARLMGLLMVFFVGATRKALQEDMEQLKAVAESQAVEV